VTFFNKKEDVLEIELTQFGKYRLSQGEFDPTYYAFFDDDIIYDASYGGIFDEAGNNQNLIEERIKNSIRNHVQHVYTGIETEVTRNNLLVRTGEVMDDGKAVFVGKKDPNLKAFKTSNDNNFSSYAPLGTSGLHSTKVPSWKIMLYEGEFSSTSIQLTSSTTSVGMKIPQLDATITYKVSIHDGLQPVPNACGVVSDDKTGNLYKEGHDINLYDDFEDASYMRVSPEQLLLKVEEINSHYTNYNFDIEVFEVTSSQDFAGNIQQEWAPLFFKAGSDLYRGSQQIQSEEYLEEEFMELDSTYVKYFIDLNTDREISDKDLCAIVAADEDRKKELYGTEYDCPDLDLLRQNQRLGGDIIKDVYVSSVGQEDIEECE